MPNGSSVSSQWDQSISVFRVVGWCFSFLCKFLKIFCMQIVENLIRRRVSAASDLVLHCLPMSHKKDARHIWVKFIETCEKYWIIFCHYFTAKIVAVSFQSISIFKGQS